MRGLNSRQPRHAASCLTWARYDLKDYQNTFGHLTNSSLGKLSPDLERDKPVIGKGCKWTVDRAFDFLAEHQGMDREAVWKRIQGALVRTTPCTSHSAALWRRHRLLDNVCAGWMVRAAQTW